MEYNFELEATVTDLRKVYAPRCCKLSAGVGESRIPETCPRWAAYVASAPKQGSVTGPAGSIAIMVRPSDSPHATTVRLSPISM
jgi:hypothetical protein